MFTASTTSITGTRTNGSASVTGIASTVQIAVGSKLEGTGITTGTTITAKTASTITMSNSFTGSTGSGSITVFSVGNGDGSTTFNLPDVRGRVLAAPDNLGGTDASVLTSAAPTSCNASGQGATCGNQQGTLTEAQLPIVSKTVATTSNGSHTHDFIYKTANAANTPAQVSLVDTIGTSGSNTATTASSGAHTHSVTVAFGSGQAHTRVLPVLVENCIIKAQ